MTNLGLVFDSIFFPTETHYPSTKIEVTDRGNALRRTNCSQLDDEPKEKAAVEKDARTQSYNQHRLVVLIVISCLEEI